MKKRLISLLLVVVMLLGVVALTACNKTPAEDTKAPEETKAPAKQTEVPDETEAPEEKNWTWSRSCVRPGVPPLIPIVTTISTPIGPMFPLSRNLLPVWKLLA